MTERYYARIAGNPFESGSWYPVVNPSTESVIAESANCGSETVAAAAQAAASAAPQWAATSLDVRRNVLAHAAQLLAERTDELVELAITDTGAREPIARSLQVTAAINRLRDWSTYDERLLLPAQPPQVAGLHSDVQRVPVGVLACISPYNFPLLAMIGKIAPALFAGNAVVMKPAPQDPLLVAALGEALDVALAEAGAPPGTSNLLLGESASLGAELVERDEVGGISFTGSTAVGISIHRSAAARMKHLLLELGGKGAVIVRRDADLDHVVASVARTWAVQSGQVCLTPARIIADTAIYPLLRDKLRAELDRQQVGDPRLASTTVGPVITDVQRDRIRRLVGTASDAGRTIDGPQTLPRDGYFAAPQLISDCDPLDDIMQQEVFGPVLSMTRFDGDDDAVAIANGTPYALYDYIFSADQHRAQQLATRLQSAQVGINTTRRNSAAPFGGNHASGIGRSGGIHSLDAYTTLQTHTFEASTLAGNHRNEDS